MDLANRSNVNTFLLAVAIRNAPGKSSNSKSVRYLLFFFTYLFVVSFFHCLLLIIFVKATLGYDGILSVYTIFEDSLNCSNYLERKVVTGIHFSLISFCSLYLLLVLALNDFRPPAGLSAPAKIVCA